jgi:hypothetical protein
LIPPHDPQEVFLHIRQGSTDPAQLRLKIGESETLLGEYKETLASFETAAVLAGPEQAAAIDHKLGQVYHRLGNWIGGEESIRRPEIWKLVEW